MALFIIMHCDCFPLTVLVMQIGLFIILFLQSQKVSCAHNNVQPASVIMRPTGMIICLHFAHNEMHSKLSQTQLHRNIDAFTTFERRQRQRNLIDWLTQKPPTMGSCSFYLLLFLLLNILLCFFVGGLEITYSQWNLQIKGVPLNDLMPRIDIKLDCHSFFTGPKLWKRTIPKPMRAGGGGRVEGFEASRL